MKKLIFILVVFCSAITSSAQNVGIGTTTPASKLHLVGNLLQENGTVTLNNPGGIVQFQNLGANKIYVQLAGDNLRLGTNSGNQLGKTIIRMAGRDRVFIDSTGNTQILGLQDASLTSHGYITLGSITGRNMILDNNEIIVRDNGGVDNLILQNDGGNVGIGVASPTAKLHINGDIKITDGTEGNGKVLTSDASGNASWKSAAFGNNDRILIRFNGNGLDSLIDGTTTVYDNGGISFSFITTRFTVSKSGLYHFEGSIQHKVAFTVPATYETIEMAAFVSINGGFHLPLNSYFQQSVVSIDAPVFIIPFKIDLYLAAGSYVVFKIKNDINANPTNPDGPGFISAYLINE